MNESTQNIKILISGGGTGGHIFPAISIANALKKIVPTAQFLFVGAKGKIEMEKVPKAGYDIIGLTIAGFHRKMNLKNIFRNLSFPFKLVGSLFKAIFIVKKFKPDVAIGVGGYASGPTLKAANWLNIPTILQEQNSLPGITNKILGTKAKKICVAYSGMESYFPKEKLVVTGNPVRDSIKDINVGREEASRTFGLDPMKPIVFITGGSLGAGAINKAIKASYELLKNEEIQLIWQCGKLYLNQYEKLETESIKVLDFITNMNHAYVCADILVTRAGASTISELALVEKPAILLPSPNVAEDHQTKNVKALVEKNAAILIKDINANATLGTEIISLLKDEERKVSLSKNIKLFAKPNAAKDIAEVVLNVIKENE